MDARFSWLIDFNFERKGIGNRSMIRFEESSVAWVMMPPKIRCEINKLINTKIHIHTPTSPHHKLIPVLVFYARIIPRRFESRRMCISFAARIRDVKYVQRALERRTRIPRRTHSMPFSFDKHSFACA